MRVIKSKEIINVVSELCGKANINLRDDVLAKLKQAFGKENNRLAKNALKLIIENARIAKCDKLAICQDTGMPVVFVEIGKDMFVKGESLESSIQKGVKLGYKKSSLRNSIIQDPLRINKQNSYFGPAVTHYEYNNSNKIKITVLPKGFGCENKSQLKMFLPTAKLEDIKKFILETVKAAGPDACPPYVVGVGIGGTADYAAFLSKKALLGNISGKSSKLESELLSGINKLNIGPMGLGGKTTALAVKALTYPTHIAGLPVAVNISCHALRSATKIL